MQILKKKEIVGRKFVTLPYAEQTKKKKKKCIQIDYCLLWLKNKASVISHLLVITLLIAYTLKFVSKVFCSVTFSCLHEAWHHKTSF